MHMRFRLLGAVLVFCLAATAQTQPLNLDQLMKFLSSSLELKMTDTELAKYLAKTKLSERLDDAHRAAHAAGPVGVAIQGQAGRRSAEVAATARSQCHGTGGDHRGSPRVRAELQQEPAQFPVHASGPPLSGGRPREPLYALQRTLLGAGGPADDPLELLRSEGRVQADPAQQQPDQGGLQVLGRGHLDW